MPKYLLYGNGEYERLRSFQTRELAEEEARWRGFSDYIVKPEYKRGEFGRRRVHALYLRSHRGEN